ncbi:MAG TPA: MFS transporter [Gaiellaceae bacterium]|nr:MFS transporter [Gaiellaceae bacterium]
MRRPRGPLWHNGDFLFLWSAQSVSQVGSQVTGLALPLAAIFVLKASTFEVAALNVVDLLPFVLFSLPAGVWVDRLRRRPLMIAADWGRAAALASIPLAYAFHGLTLPQLFLVGFATGTLTVFFDVSYQSYLPSLVEKTELGEANSKLEVSRSVAQLGGPGLAGALVGAITAPYAIAVDAASFVGSALLLGTIRSVEALPESLAATRRRMREEIGEGLRYLVRHPIMRPMMLWVAASNFAGNILFSIFIVFAVRDLHLHAATIGLLFSLGNVGTLLGALTAMRLSRRFGIGPAMLGYATVGGAAPLLIPLARDGYAIPFIVAAQFVFGYCAIGANINGISLVQAITPDRMLGRMTASRRFVVWGVIPVGGLIGGALGSQVGLRTALWVGAVGQALAFLPVLFSPIRRIRVVEDAEALA